MNILTNKLKKAAKRCNLLSNKILGKVALTAASLTTVGLIAFIIHGFTQLPDHVRKEWETHRIGPNIAEMDRLAALSPDQLKQIYENTRYFSTEENLILDELSRKYTYGATGLTAAWRSMNPNRPREASVKEEVVNSLGKTWRQYNTPTCARHASQTLIRHRLTKDGAVLPAWNALDTGSNRALPLDALKAHMRLRKVNLKIRNLFTSYAVRNRAIWVPLMLELIKQEIAAGRPVLIMAMSAPPPAFLKKHGNILKCRCEYGEQTEHPVLHAYVVVSYKESDKDGTSWEVWDSTHSENHGIITATPGFFAHSLENDVYVVE